MTERSRPVADLDTRLAEFDRKLREIQADLAPGREPRPAASAVTRGRSGPLADLLQHASPPEPQAPPPQAPPTEPLPPLPTEPPPPERRVRPPRSEPPLDELHQLLSSLHEVLHGIEALLERKPEGTREATIATGPFSTIEEVRKFERELASVPGVRGVAVRGYEGAARAIIDVQLIEDH